MNRRELLQGAGLMALAGMAADAFAENSGHLAVTDTSTLAQTAAECVRTGEACLAHCIEMLSKGDTDMADCAKSVSQLIPLCSALQALASQKSPYTSQQAKVAMQACKECQKECEKFPQHAVCKACAEACADCYKQCEKITV